MMVVILTAIRFIVFICQWFYICLMTYADNRLNVAMIIVNSFTPRYND
jgi:hypothetical protein